MPRWTVEMGALLGTMKDADIVRQLNCKVSVGFVAHRRRELGIPYVRKCPSPHPGTHYDLMLEAQDGGCAICDMTPEEHGRYLFIDHDHNTGMVRGVLCHGCNVRLGYHRGGFHNSPGLLGRVEEYLRRSRIKREPRVLGKSRRCL